VKELEKRGAKAIVFDVEFYERHRVRPEQDQAFNEAIRPGGGGLKGEAARAFARVGMEGYVRGLSREDEMEADAIGVVIAAGAAYEPYGLTSVLQTLARIPSSNADMALFLKTHSSPSDRLAALEQKVPAWFKTLAKPNDALVRFNQAFKPVTASNQ
jgi:predicted Zn-dependent protease